MTLNLLRKLQRVGVGVNSVEIFAKKNSGEGTRKEKRRRRMEKKVRMSRKRMRKERRGRSGRKTGFCQLLPPSASIPIAGFEVRQV